jgi:hypothetical protein
MRYFGLRLDVAANGRTHHATQRAVSFLPNWHLRRKAARVDAEIDERVNDGSADERGDDDYQHFRADGTHTGNLPKRGVIDQKRRFQENTPAARRPRRVRYFGQGWRNARRRLT